MSEEKTYAIQSSDLSIKDEGPWGSPGKMVDLFQSYDWSSEHSLLEKLEREEAGELCPPGLILLREIGVYFHLCPHSDGTVTIYCTQRRPRKLFGVFKYTTYKLVTKERASHALALRAIAKFMADDEDWLQANIKEDSLS